MKPPIDIMPIPIWKQMEQTQPFSHPQDVELTVLLPSEVLKAVQEYAAEYRITPHQVIERAISQFLDLEIPPDPVVEAPFTYSQSALSPELKYDCH
ncbi:MAG: hypothetical protein QNJ46_35260 [Leptolyngbyaceae cyanobacterium MO_188.B28]|nr:hypothetical protein [Leptolyngbyaceae cyanobacterium MO_188.B28]